MAGPATHDWLIEPREYARQESRRGRRHAYDSLDPRRTALVVVDLVPFFFDDDMPFVRGIVPQVNALATATRATGGAVVWVTPANTGPTAWHEGFFGPEVAALYTSAGGDGRVWHELEVAEEDLFVEKQMISAFFPGSSDLAALLGERGIDTVLVTGTVTNVCVEGTVRDAAALGFRVVLAADGCAARRDQDHNATLHTVYRTFGDVRPTAEIVDLLRSG